MNLEFIAMRWLWLEKNCHYILEERSPRCLIGQPDILGVTAARFLIEIEVKRSASDFAADFKKRHRAERSSFLKSAPKFFYYMMEKDLAERLLPRVPEWAGLLCADKESPQTRYCNILKPAPANEESRRLSLKECARMCRMMTNHMMGYAQGADTRMQMWSNNDTTWHVDFNDPEIGTYNI